MAGIDVSVVIPAKNGARYLDEVLKMVYAQACNYTYEVIVIDSGSTDGTLDIVKRYPLRLIEIRPDEFGHGKTRNLGASIAKGRYLVFITQDAVPATDQWLTRLVQHLERDMIAGAYGGQIPRDDTNPVEQFFLRTRYPAQGSIKHVGNGKTNMHTIFFSNANSAIRREFLQKYPFPDDLIMSEDQEWAKRVLLEGYRIAYDPEAAVYHSHNFSVETVFRRYFDSGVSLGQFARDEYSSRSFVSGGLYHVRHEMRYLLRSGNRRWIPYAVLYDLSKFVGVSLGKRHRCLPACAKRRLSMHSQYWSGTT
jgi:rhamnosyltransferase